MTLRLSKSALTSAELLVRLTGQNVSLGTVSAASAVLGTDPGGSALLRVGGAVACTALMATVADAVIGAKVQGATGKLVAYGFYNSSIGALINSLSANEISFLPMTLQSSQFYFEQGPTTFRGTSPGTPASTEVSIGGGAIKAGGTVSGTAQTFAENQVVGAQGASDAYAT